MYSYVGLDTSALVSVYLVLDKNALVIVYVGLDENAQVLYVGIDRNAQILCAWVYIRIHQLLCLWVEIKMLSCILYLITSCNSSRSVIPHSSVEWFSPSHLIDLISVNQQ